MTTLTMMRGYPGSGKSTVAKQIADATGAALVCRDDLRKMFFGVYWTGNAADEQLVTIAEKALVHRFLEQEYDVVVDATNLHPKAHQRWKSIAQAHEVDFVVHNVTTPVETCIARDIMRGAAGQRRVGVEVINRMAAQYPIKDWVL